MNRRAVLAGFAALASASAIALPLGLRLTQQAVLAANSSAPTPDGYITDGLIAMWDGEWNAGRGVHDSAATVWKDLVGTRDLTMLDMTTSSRCWEKNCAYTDVGNLTRYSSWAAIAEARAIECVYMPTKYGASYAGVLVMNNVINATTEAQGYVVNILTRFHDKGVDGIQVANDKFAYFDTKSVFNTIYTYTAQYSTVYRNAVGFEVQTMTEDGWSGNTVSIACRDNDTRYNSPGRFYCVRIYDRELTAAEVAHNYEVDRRRFGSGNE